MAKQRQGQVISFEDAELLIDPRGTVLLGHRQEGMVFMVLGEEDLRRYLRTATKIVIESWRETPGGFQVVLYSGKTAIGYLGYTARKARALLSG